MFSLLTLSTYVHTSVCRLWNQLSRVRYAPAVLCRRHAFLKSRAHHSSRFLSSLLLGNSFPTTANFAPPPPCGIRGRLGRARRVNSDRYTCVAPASPPLLLVAEYATVYERAGTKHRDDVTRWRLGDDGWPRIWSSCLVSLHFAPLRPASAP